MQAVNEQETISVGDKIYIAVPQTDVTVNGKTDAVSGAVNEELDVKIWFELGTTSDSRNHFYYKLPEGITVQDITNHPLLDGNETTRYLFLSGGGWGAIFAFGYYGTFHQYVWTSGLQRKFFSGRNIPI